jgi:DNA modification methylase
MVKILTGDALEVLKTLPSETVNCIVTSPPYYGLRDYGVDGQIGLEQTPEEYISKLVAVFHEARRVLRNDGTLWVNIGDSYCSPKTGASTSKSGLQGGLKTQHEALKRPDKMPSGDVKQKDLIGIPWMLAFALRADGWYLRQDIIWSKPNPMPESVTDRCTKSHEYIFLLSKSKQYYYDAEAIAEESVVQPENTTMKSVKQGGFNDKGEIPGSGQRAFRAITETRNKRSVWEVSTKPYKEAHFATFPEDLIVPCILAGCPENGTVLDMFGGSGTTGIVASGNNRNATLIDLNPEYSELQRGRCGMFAERSAP